MDTLESEGHSTRPSELQCQPVSEHNSQNPGPDFEFSFPLEVDEFEASSPECPITTTVTNNESKEEIKKSGKSGRIYSKWWSYYEQEVVNGLKKARCKYCNFLMGGDPKDGTTALKNHYNRCRKRKNYDARQKQLKGKYEKDNQCQLSSNFQFDQDASRVELARMIILHEYPLSIVEHFGFRNFCTSLNPCFKMISRNTAKSDCFKIYDIEKKEAMLILEKNEGRVALTTDMWSSSHQPRGFMAVTAHYIDSSWILQSRIISFIYLPSPHTAEVLCDALVHCLMDWNIDRKLSTITVDNCTTNDAMMALILNKIASNNLLLGGRFFHMRCAAHILNLIVKDGMQVIDAATEKIRSSVAYWSCTAKRFEKFEETARQLRIPIGKVLALDCKTRWNSTYLMLQIALDYKCVFSRLKLRDPKYTCLPSEHDWNMTREIASRLKVFYNATEVFSGTKYPTANMFFPNICVIKVALKQWLSCGVKVVESMAEIMMKKFDKYWTGVHGIMSVAAILDPRYKATLLEFYLKKIYIEQTVVDNEVHQIILLCRELVEEYESIEQVKGDSIPMVTTENNVDSVEWSDFTEFETFASQKKRKYPSRSELDQYLEDDILPRTPDFDVLAWWKSNRGKYPILHKIAKDILSIPVSTVASESAFSASGRLISPHRSRLHPKTIEVLMCSQSWLLKGNPSKEIAHSTILYDSEDNDNNVPA